MQNNTAEHINAAESNGEKEIYIDQNELLGKYVQAALINGSASPEGPAKVSERFGSKKSDQTARDRVELQTLNRSLASFKSAFAALSAIKSPKKLLDAFSREITHLLEANSCFVYEFSAFDEELTPVIAYPKEIDLFEFSLFHFAQLDEYEAIQYVLREKQGLQKNKISHTQELQTAALLRTFSAESMLVLPMISQEKPMGIVLVVDNVSPRRFSDSQISLAQMLTDQASAALANARLYQGLIAVNYQLEDMNAELDSYAHSVAHNLKNPLANIMGFTQIVRNGLKDLSYEELAQYLGYISASASKIQEIIEALLVLAGIRQEQVDVEALDMKEVISEAISTLSTMIDEFQPEIIFPEHWPTVWGNKVWVEQIWINYISNAIKYGDRPPVVHLGSNTERDDKVRFWISDNGPGLSKEQQEQLYRPFTRMTSSPVNGHGLGLSIVKRMVIKLGGQVGVEGQPGEGSTFYFTLPELPPTI